MEFMRSRCMRFAPIVFVLLAAACVLTAQESQDNQPHIQPRQDPSPQPTPARRNNPKKQQQPAPDQPQNAEQQPASSNPDTARTGESSSGDSENDLNRG